MFYYFFYNIIEKKCIYNELIKNYHYRYIIYDFKLIVNKLFQKKNFILRITINRLELYYNY